MAPNLDFEGVEDVKDFSPIPKDKYPCIVDQVVEKKTTNDDEMWRLKWKVLSGKYEGRTFFDNMVFSEAAMKRVKLICSRLGLDVSGKISLTTDMVEGAKALVSVEVEDYDAEDDDGNPVTKQRNTVPFAGYERLKGEAAAAGAGSGGGGGDGLEEAPF